MNLDFLFYPSRIENDNRLILLDKKEIKSTGIFGVEFNMANASNFEQFKVIYDGVSVTTSANVSLTMNLNNDFGATSYGGYYLRGTSATVSAAALSTDTIQVGVAENTWRGSGEITISNQKDIWKPVVAIFGKADYIQISYANWKNYPDKVNKISIQDGSSTYPFQIGAVFRLYGLR